MDEGEAVDPFDVFGESDDDDSNGNNENAISIAKTLIKAANDKISLASTKATEIPPETTKQLAKSVDQYEEEDLSDINEWENTWPNPAYKGEILLASNLEKIGGGRGYVATDLISPGTLVLVESPMIEWPEEQLGKKLGMVSVKHLIKHPKASQFLHDLEDFYPSKEQVDGRDQNGNYKSEEANEKYEQISKMMDLLFSEYSVSSEGENEGQNQKKELLDLVELAGKLGVRSRDGSVLNSTDIIRILLVLRYNGLESGLYRHVAMLNHSDYPNCAKFLPDNGKSLSEVRTTRLIQKGEPLTISYLPRIVSHASRRKILWEQHRFDIGVKHLKGEKYKMELIGMSLPPSPIHRSVDKTLTDRIESTTYDLEQLYSEMIEGNPHAPATIPTESFETAKALEQTLLELYNTSGEQLQNSSHILLIPILTLHIETCAFLLKDPSLTNSNQLGVLSRQTLSGHRLLPLQNLLFGPDHFALARTSLDLADSISQLLSRSPKSLYDLKLPLMNTFAAWSKFENGARKDHNRIKALYPYDIEKHVNI